MGRGKPSGWRELSGCRAPSPPAAGGVDAESSTGTSDRSQLAIMQSPDRRRFPAPPCLSSAYLSRPLPLAAAGTLVHPVRLPRASEALPRRCAARPGPVRRSQARPAVAACGSRRRLAPGKRARLPRIRLPPPPQAEGGRGAAPSDAHEGRRGTASSEDHDGW